LTGVVKEVLPSFYLGERRNAYRSYTSKHILSWKRYVRQREDGLFDCLHVSRDYSAEGGYEYGIEGYAGFFHRLTYPVGAFGYYFPLYNILFEDEPRLRALGKFCGADWFSLGETIKDAELNLRTAVCIFRDCGLPHLETKVTELKGDPILKHALTLTPTIRVRADDAPATLTHQVETLATTLRKTSEKSKQGYPADRVAYDLVMELREQQKEKQ
jgi:hypothetical protein